MAIKYFLYSEEQIEEKNKILARTNKQFVPGIVTVSGRRMRFSQLSDTPTISRFIDTKVIASGELSNFTYVLPSTELKKG